MVFAWLILSAARADSFSVLLGGDIMLNAIRPSDQVFADVRPLVSDARLALGNLEIPLTDARTSTRRKTPEELRRRDQFVLKADPKHATYLADAGFDLVSQGNNHAMDYGAAGLDQMNQALDRVGIGHTGAGDNAEEAMRPVTRQVGNRRVALISAMAFVSTRALWKVTAATDTEAGVHGLDLAARVDDAAKARLSAWIATARARADFVIVAVHWGTERKTLPNAYQVNLGRALVDSGADLVWGHHPHVLQGAEWYRGKPILYSMGNLISPTPAESGFVKFQRFEGGDACEFIPTRIRGGRVSRVTGPSATAARRRFAGLCRSLLQKYPNLRSRPFTVWP